MSYGWRSARLAHTLRVNGNNLADTYYVGPDLNRGLGRQIIMTYTLSFQ